MKIKFTLIFAFFCLSSVFSQKNNFNLDKIPEEKSIIHLNDNIFLTDEKIYFKIYNTLKNNTLSPYSKITYIDIINSKNISVLKRKIKLNKGTGYGDIFIPSSIETGGYKIISYTNWMLNKGFYESDILIINPFSNKKNKSNIKNTKIKIVSNTNDNINKKQYSKRSLVRFLTNLKEKGNYSVSVKRVNNLNISEKSGLKNNNYINKKTNSFHLPELRGETISGTINSKKDKVNDIKISLSIQGKQPITKIVTTNKTGEFNFNFNNLNGSKATIHVLDTTTTYTIKLNSKLEKFNSSNFASINIDSNIVNFIKEKSIYTQIENSYNSVKKDTEVLHKHDNYIFTGNEKKYVLDDYKRFNTINEVVIEIIKDVWLSKKNNQYNFHVRDLNLSTNSAIPTLLIVDGLIVYNHNNLIGFDAKQVKSISVVREKYVFGNTLYQGILIFNTFKNNYNLDSKNTKTIDLLKPEVEKKYFFQKHNTPELTKRVPDYRTQLYWNPNISSVTKEITFYTSDVTGEFEIEIQGITDQGKNIQIKNTFTVK